MPSLTYTFRGDTSPLRQASQKLGPMFREAGKVAGKEFGNQFKSLAMSFIGLSAIKSTLQKVVQDALRIDQGALASGLGVEAFQELEKAAQLTGLSVEELRKVAPEAAAEFTRLMDTVRESGGILSKETVDQLANAADMFAQAFSKIAPVLGGLLAFTDREVRRVRWGVGGALRAVAPLFGSREQEVRLTGELTQADALSPERMSTARRQAAREFVSRVQSNQREAEAAAAAEKEAVAELKRINSTLKSLDDKL